MGFAVGAHGRQLISEGDRVLFVVYGMLIGTKQHLSSLLGCAR